MSSCRLHSHHRVINYLLLDVHVFAFPLDVSQLIHLLMSEVSHVFTLCTITFFNQLLQYLVTTTTVMIVRKQPQT